MPQGEEVIETGRLVNDRGRLVLLRDDGGAWGVFLDRNPRDWLGHRVTVRGTRYDFASLHVSGIAKGFEIPPERKATGKVRFALLALTIAAGWLALLWSAATTLATLFQGIKLG